MIEVKIEPGPGCKHPAPDAWHWAIYEGDDFVGSGNRWYSNPEAAAQVADRLFRPEMKITIRGKEWKRN